MAGIEMKPGRAFSFMTGVALLGAIAKFNEMTPAAQASWLGSAAETARTAQSWLQNAVVTYGDLAGKTAADPAPQQPLEPRSTPTSPPNPSQPAAPAREGRESQGAPSQRVAVQTGDVELRASAGNPLWVLPLKQLSSTRDRPVFSPSRRPPPMPTLVAPVAVRQPVKPAEPEKPAVSLLGTIIGIDDRIGVFLETGTQNIVRLRVGDDHQGWVLRLIKAREVTLVKDHEQVAVLDLPPPGEAPGGMPVPGMAGIPGGGIPGMGTPPVGTPVRGGMPPGVGLPPGVVLPPGAVPANQRQQQQQQSRRQGR
jgi:general secretion pathway protein N